MEDRDGEDLAFGGVAPVQEVEGSREECEDSADERNGFEDWWRR